MSCSGFFIYPKVKRNRIQNGGGKDIGVFSSEGKAGVKDATAQENALRRCPQR